MYSSIYLVALPTRQIKQAHAREGNQRTNCEKCPKFKRLNLVMQLAKFLVLLTKIDISTGFLAFSPKGKIKREENPNLFDGWQMG